MSWYQKLMKDVEGCDMLRWAAKQALIRRIPNWETCRKKHIVFLFGSYRDIITWINRVIRGTKGTETSKYLQEKKEKSISPVAASEKERA